MGVGWGRGEGINSAGRCVEIIINKEGLQYMIKSKAINEEKKEIFYSKRKPTTPHPPTPTFTRVMTHHKRTPVIATNKSAAEAAHTSAARTQKRRVVCCIFGKGKDGERFPFHLPKGCARVC